MRVREGEHDGPRDSGSATAGCYVSAPPAPSPRRLSRLCFPPIPHPAAAAHFFFPLRLTWLLTWPPPSLFPSLHHSPAVSFSRSPPPTCIPGEPPTSAACMLSLSLSLSLTPPSLRVLSACLSLSHYSHQSFLSVCLCRAVRLQLHAQG